jgi:hypothetical protein
MSFDGSMLVLPIEEVYDRGTSLCPEIPLYHPFTKCLVDMVGYVVGLYCFR